MFLRLLGAMLIVTAVAASASATLVVYCPMNETVNPSAGTTQLDVVHNPGGLVSYAIVGGTGPGPDVGETAADPYFGTAVHYSAADQDMSFFNGAGASATALHALASDFTAAAWVKPDASAPGVGECILGAAMVGSSGWEFGIIDNKLGLQATLPGEVGWKCNYIGPNSAITPGVWTHVALSLDAAGNLKLYRNGSLTDTITGASTAAGGANWFMAFDAAGNTLTGAIDELRVYNTVLTQGEIAGLMTIPEPNTLALLAAGVLGLLAYAWRKRK